MRSSNLRAFRPGAIWFILIVGLVVFAGANAHLLYVALESDPGCVDHLKEAGSAPGEFRAAKSSC